MRPVNDPFPKILPRIKVFQQNLILAFSMPTFLPSLSNTI